EAAAARLREPIRPEEFDEDFPRVRPPNMVGKIGQQRAGLVRAETTDLPLLLSYAQLAQKLDGTPCLHRTPCITEGDGRPKSAIDLDGLYAANPYPVSSMRPRNFLLCKPIRV